MTFWRRENGKTGKRENGKTNRREVTLRILLTFTAFCDCFVKRHILVSATHLVKVARPGYF